MEREDRIDERAAAMMQFAEEADRLHPAKRLLDEFPFLLTEGVAGGRVVRPSMALLRRSESGYCATCGVTRISRDE